MDEIIGNWYVTFRKYVSSAGENLGLYESHCNVVFKKIDNTNFLATFNVETAEVNGEPIEFGQRVFEGKLIDNNIYIQFDCEDEFLNTGVPYTATFSPIVQTGKLYGKSESSRDELVDNYSMTYRIVMEFIQE